MKRARHALAAATLALWTVTAVPLAQAQPSSHPARASSPRVGVFDMRQVDHVEPGAELDFTPWGTPGARAVLAIDGAARPLRLSETSPGRYTLVAQFDGLSMKRDVSVTRSGTTLNGVLPSSLD